MDILAKVLEIGLVFFPWCVCARERERGLVGALNQPRVQSTWLIRWDFAELGQVAP